MVRKRVKPIKHLSSIVSENVASDGSGGLYFSGAIQTGAGDSRAMDVEEELHKFEPVPFGFRVVTGGIERESDDLLATP